MDRVEFAKETRSNLFHAATPAGSMTDPEFIEILNRFLFGEVWQHGNLDAKTRELITIVVLTTNQTPDQLRAHIDGALNVAVTPVEVKEALYQCAPYIGFAKTLVGIAQANKVFEERGIKLPVEGQSSVTEETRLEKGLAVQKSIFGAEHIDSMRASAPEYLKHIQDYLSAYCFGDIYTRGGLNIKMRELLTFSILCTLGGAENQLRAHVQANTNVGNGKDVLIDALSQCMPYIGFPRTLNALAVINEVLPPENK
jgi:Uncharacterized homolog of gamma-carboxymuconolactone decarboxylase subunit